MDKLIYYNELFTIYEKLFTDNQKDIFRLYYEENLSLQEIADLKSVSRAFVSKSINLTVKKLEEYEEALECLKRKEQVKQIIQIDDLVTIKNKLNKLY